MIKKVLVALTAMVFILSAAHAAYVLYPTEESQRFECNTRWVGPIEYSFADKVRIDLEVALAAKCGTLRAALMSPGGSVVWSVETSQEIKRARKKGLIV